MEENETETQRAFFPKTSSEHYPIPKQNRNLHERMAELLLSSGYEKEDRETKLMAIPQNSHVFVEDVEKTKS